MSNSSETDAEIQRVLGLPAAERTAVAIAILDCIDAENQDVRKPKLMQLGRKRSLNASTISGLDG